VERQRIARLLPEIFQRTLPTGWAVSAPGKTPTPGVLGAFLGVMERLHAPSEAALEHLDTYFDPRQAPEEWLPFLALWLDLDRLLTYEGKFPGGAEGLRRLILAAVALAKERGTHAGLRKFLETATGISGIEIETASDRPYHIVVVCPEPEPRAYGMTLVQFCNWLDALIAAEKPAYVTSDVYLKGPGGLNVKTFERSKVQRF
jgi:phage tail-like protein